LAKGNVKRISNVKSERGGSARARIAKIVSGEDVGNPEFKLCVHAVLKRLRSAGQMESRDKATNGEE